MRTPLTRTTGVLAGALVMLLLALPMTAAAAATANKVPNGDEAWFLAKKEVLAEPTGEDPTCNLPTGCNASGQAQRPNPHPEGVLVVAANGGEPDAQMFINFDPAKLPSFEAVVTGGKVTLPVAEDPEARNANPGAAKMVACRVTGFIPAGSDAGSYKDRPTFDDKTCVPAKKVEQKAETDPLVFTVDLERFGKVWSADAATMQGITLLPDPAQVKPPAPQETWRAVFNTQRRSDQMTEEEKKKPDENARINYPAITWDLQYKIKKLPSFQIPSGGSLSGSGSAGGFPAAESSSGGDFSSGDSSVASSDTGSTDFGSAPADTGSAAIDVPADSGAAPVTPPVTTGAPAGAAAPVAAGPTTPVSAPGPSPAVWVLPILAVLMAVAMAWSLMQPVQLVGEREGAVSRLMRTRRLAAQNPSAPS